MNGKLPTSPKMKFNNTGNENELKNATIKLNSQVIDSEIDYIEKNVLTGDFLSNRDMFNIERGSNGMNFQNTYEVQNGKNNLLIISLL
ncbi:hypothetical protein GW820_06430 [archaeon]|nr:hypothetical protein [archaeon]